MDKEEAEIHVTAASNNDPPTEGTTAAATATATPQIDDDLAKVRTLQSYCGILRTATRIPFYFVVTWNCRTFRHASPHSERVD